MARDHVAKLVDCPNQKFLSIISQSLNFTNDLGHQGIDKGTTM